MVSIFASFNFFWSTFRPLAAGQIDTDTTHSPGRFLVEQMLKMLLAYMTMHYDIEYLSERPANFVLGPINVPPPAATIKVRRRKIMVE